MGNHLYWKMTELFHHLCTSDVVIFAFLDDVDGVGEDKVDTVVDGKPTISTFSSGFLIESLMACIPLCFIAALEITTNIFSTNKVPAW